MRPTRTAAGKARDRRAPLRIAVTNGLGVPARGPGVSGLSGLSRWLARAAPAGARGTMTIALVSDRQMRRLNREYRRIDRPTDVLSFPGEAKSSPDDYTGSDLGDIAISLDTAKRHARELGHSLGTELRVLALHGLLHLLGYDHERDSGEMTQLERRIARRVGLPSTLTLQGLKPKAQSPKPAE